jgi:photosystem II stability/assembly factor-like uncharacterized protein
MFVSVSSGWYYDGSAGTILTSSDNGTTWVGSNVVTTSLSGVTYGNSMFVAVGEDNMIITGKKR